MKRGLLLSLGLMLVLAVPNVASACNVNCDPVLGVCYYDPGCVACNCQDNGGGYCWFNPCFAGSTEKEEPLASKWTIASIEIERRVLPESLDGKQRLAENKDRVPSRELLSVE